ncbi:MAG: DUF5011 domain-containing protein [Bacteroidales bacterium]|nr:DUF5011 domain-containing protein [Bacteroidales bacterium]
MKQLTFLVLAFIVVLFSCQKEEDKDTTAPSINIIGDNTISIFQDSSYIDLGYKATDNIDGDITYKVIVTGTVDTTTIGTYIIKYNVKDEAGNSAVEVIKTVVISRYLIPKIEQNGFAINYTAAWCEYCGIWGIPLIHDMATLAPNGAILSIHVSGDPMENALYLSFASERSPNGGIPAFWVGDIKTANINEMVQLLNSGDADAGVDYSYSIDNNKMTIKTKTQFYIQNSGVYYLSIIILEDGIDGSSNAPIDFQQQGVSNSYPNDDYTHDFVVRRSSLSTYAYGEQIAKNPDYNSFIEKNYEIELESNWQNPYPVAIIWEYKPNDSPKYHFVNSLKRKN